jgi:hypothetical protein
MLLSSNNVDQSQMLLLSDCIWFLTVPLVINICSVRSSHILAAEMLHFTDTSSDSMVMQFVYHDTTMYKWQIC